MPARKGGTQRGLGDAPCALEAHAALWEAKALVCQRGGERRVSAEVGGLCKTGRSVPGTEVSARPALLQHGFLLRRYMWK